MAAWLDLIGLVGTDPGTHWRSVGVHRGEKKGEAPVLVDLDLPAPVDAAADRRQLAIDALEVAVDCYRRGTAEPVPLFPRVSHAAWTGRYSSADWLHPMGWGDGAHPMTSMVYEGIDLRALRALPAPRRRPRAGRPHRRGSAGVLRRAPLGSA